MVLASPTAKWEEATLESRPDSLRSLLLAAAATPETPLKMLPLQDEDAVLDFYKKLNQTASDYPAQACVHDLVAQQAELRPEAAAVVFGSRRLTYL